VDLWVLFIVLAEDAIELIVFSAVEERYPLLVRLTDLRLRAQQIVAYVDAD
jgi:hypothetical protein